MVTGQASRHSTKKKLKRSPIEPHHTGSVSHFVTDICIRVSVHGHPMAASFPLPMSEQQTGIPRGPSGWQ